MIAILGLFDDEKRAGRAINRLSRSEFGGNLSVITFDQIMHDPPTVDARQLGGSVQRGRGEQAVARKREKGSSPRPRIVFNSPGRTVNVLGSAGVREFLVAKGIGEEEVAYFSEGVKNGGILVLVEAQDDQKPFVLDIMQEELAVTETMDGQAG